VPGPRCEQDTLRIQVRNVTYQFSQLTRLEFILIHLFYNVKINRFIYCPVLMWDAVAPTEIGRLIAVSQELATSRSPESHESSLHSPNTILFWGLLSAVAGYSPRLQSVFFYSSLGLKLAYILHPSHVRYRPRPLNWIIVIVHGKIALLIEAMRKLFWLKK
jgi:hypothetical protein